MSSVSSTRYLSHSLVLVILLLPSVQARDCFDDFQNNTVVCRGLSVGARIGIALGIFVLAMILLFTFGAMRRRRIQRANLAYVTSQQAGGYQGDPYVYNQSTPQHYPPYPPQAHVDPNQYNAYQTTPAGYDTQQYNNYPAYPAPPGPPPTKQ